MNKQSDKQNSEQVNKHNDQDTKQVAKQQNNQSMKSIKQSGQSNAAAPVARAAIKSPVNRISSSVRAIDAEMKNLARRKEMLEKLNERRMKVESQLNQLDQEVGRILKGQIVVNKHETKSYEVKAQSVTDRLPRGVMTKALFDVVKGGGDKGASIDEIVDKVKMNSEIASISDLPKRIQNLLNTSEYFQRVRKGVYKVKKAPEGALFERLYAMNS